MKNSLYKFLVFSYSSSPVGSNIILRFFLIPSVCISLKPRSLIKLDYETMVKSLILFLITSCLKRIKLHIFLTERQHLSTLNKTLAALLWAERVAVVLVCIRQSLILWTVINNCTNTGDCNNDSPSNLKWKQSCINIACSTVYCHVKRYDNNPIHSLAFTASSPTSVSCGPA